MKYETALVFDIEPKQLVFSILTNLTQLKGQFEVDFSLTAKNNIIPSMIKYYDGDEYYIYNSQQVIDNFDKLWHYLEVNDELDELVFKVFDTFDSYVYIDSHDFQYLELGFYYCFVFSEYNQQNNSSLSVSINDGWYPIYFFIKNAYFVSILAILKDDIDEKAIDANLDNFIYELAKILGVGFDDIMVRNEHQNK
ncbi:hypothetical protein [Psychrobacter sp. I-STPA10]|uniref:hypothetical protein n=1 Tax=Psychrobacter sp. I-STPA10 TaxID=2585769 RepID=UPI001E41B134|nr:hypothetical protein [Psychrobacter sp. I-STPA10]